MTVPSSDGEIEPSARGTRASVNNRQRETDMRW